MGKLRLGQAWRAVCGLKMAVDRNSIRHCDQSVYLTIIVHTTVLFYLEYIVFELARIMASNESAPAHGTVTDDEKNGITGANHVDRVETQDNDISLAKVEVDAELDEFGARSKTNPAEIALVKKLDRTILVSTS